MHKYKCIIFDCDGVLVDSEVIGNKVLVDMANALGADIDLDYAMTYFKGSFLKDCIEQISKLVEVDVPPSFESNYRKKSFEAFKTQLKPVKGVAELLRTIPLPFCVASSGPENKIRLNLELTGLLPYFEGNIFSCYTIKKWKPEPDIFLWAAETMGFKPSECLVIEDSVLGVEAAKAGGFDVYGYTEHDHENKLEALTTKTFNSMSKLLNML